MDSSETPSSTSDFYATESDNKQPGLPLPPDMTEPQATTTAPQDPEQDQATDASSDMDISDASRPSSPVPSKEPLPQPLPQPLPPPSHAGVKRSLDVDTDVTDHGNAESTDHPSQRRKLSLHPSLLVSSDSTADSPKWHPEGVKALPEQLWQQVFVKVAPADLERCASSCREFRRILTSTAQPTEIGPHQVIGARKLFPAVHQVQASETVWKQSRQCFYPFLPRPLRGFTERQMLRLLFSTTCHRCNRPPSRPPPATSAYDRGPGLHSVRIIWPFGEITCGPCLRDTTISDVQLLVKGEVGRVLKNGITHIFLTPQSHYISETQRTSKEGIPHNLQATKVYRKSDFENIHMEFEDAKRLDAAEGWTQGLPKRGKDLMSDAARWEVWEKKLPPGQQISQVLREYHPSSFPHYHNRIKSAGTDVGRPAVATNGAGMMSQTLLNGTPTISAGTSMAPQNHFGASPQGYASFYPTNSGPPGALPYPMHNGHHEYVMPPGTQPWSQQGYTASDNSKQARTPQDIQAARQARKADIERRCSALDPPIIPEVLQHAPSFKNAMQISQPMTDLAWEQLRPHLEDQRDHAVEMEHDRQMQMAEFRSAQPFTAHVQDDTRPAKEVYGEAYERAQESLRLRLGEYADEFMNTQWHSGPLNRQTCPQFATECIDYVYGKYVKDVEDDKLPKPERTQGMFYGSFAEPFLSLDNMKWVWDHKIKPHAEEYTRELFTCAKCEDEVRSKDGPFSKDQSRSKDESRLKRFAFESLIQHCGAKHDYEFNKGNVVVHWQTAKWPDPPPFAKEKVKTRQNFNENGHRQHQTQKTKSSKVQRHGYTSDEYTHADTPYNGQAQHQYDQSTYGDGQHHHDLATYGHAHQHELPSAFPEDRETAMTDQFAMYAREIWDALEGVPGLPVPIRMHTTIHHACARFSAHFRQYPRLDTVTSALASNALMQPIKAANQLVCKVCVQQQDDRTAATAVEYYPRIKHMTPIGLQPLINHFKLLHLPSNPYADWTTGMIELPEDKAIFKLLRTPGMDDTKLGLVAAAIPGVFPTQLPTIGTIMADAPNVNQHEEALDRMFARGAKPKMQGKKKKKGRGGMDGTPGGETMGARQGARDDEYDPRRPAVVRNEQAPFDPSRFDTGYIPNPDEASFGNPTREPAQTAPSISLADILAAHTKSNNTPQEGQSHNGPAYASSNPYAPTAAYLPSTQHQHARSPSVGAPEPAQQSTNNGLPADISSMLARLAPHLQPQRATATPPVVPRPVSASHQTYAHYQPQQFVQYREEPPGYGEPAMYDAREMRAVLGHNAAAHERNHLGRVDWAEAPTSSTVVGRSPPRYEYERESAAPAQPVQWVRVAEAAPPPPHQFGGPSYSGSGALPEQWVVDENGRYIRVVPLDRPWYQ
ncbi:uncharacterized protein LTR77_001473 [Saxophila tyrrhenica]|uniref:F-box domain-containing protein n=1 Tax=Saxophila tyrrhenica TaxID=1690608 RepID=A0AAV9PK74_9PEZI|nr:hypothetical protein LTR77_001473 [Saxophila tyrrhenica]